MKTLEQIASYGIRTSSHVLAVSDIHKDGELSERQYRDRLLDIVKCDNSDIPVEMLPLVYGYTIQEALRTELVGKELLEFAKQSAYTFFNANTYIHATTEAEVKLDVDGKVKKKKGEKGELARQAYVDNRDNNLSRKQMIDVLVEAADMSAAGASTYYAKFKKEYTV